MSTPSETRRMVAGNWKMNLDLDEGTSLVKAVVDAVGSPSVPVVFCTPAIHLTSVSSALSREDNYHLGAQDLSAHASGAHTGELSGRQLASAGCTYVLVGHSERRSDHGEQGQLLAHKIDRALDNNLRPIFCIGETLEQRDAGDAERVVANQLSAGLSHLDSDALANVVLAYEPVWAIGTGQTASPQQAQNMHGYIRRWLSERFGESRSQRTTVLYGGSVKPGNAAELFGQTDIDGGLIGGASLKAEDFAAIVRAFG